MVVVGVVEVVVTTIKLTDGLITPYWVAAILVIPAEMPVAKPPEPAKDIVATLLLELDQIA